MSFWNGSFEYDGINQIYPAQIGLAPLNQAYSEQPTLWNGMNYYWHHGHWWSHPHNHGYFNHPHFHGWYQQRYGQAYQGVNQYYQQVQSYQPNLSYDGVSVIMPAQIGLQPLQVAYSEQPQLYNGQYYYWHHGHWWQHPHNHGYFNHPSFHGWYQQRFGQPYVCVNTAYNQLPQTMLTGNVCTSTYGAPTGAFDPFISAFFNRRVQLWNLHGKFLMSGNYGDRAKAHHDPNHGFPGSSLWIIEAHSQFTDRVAVRSAITGAFLVHEGHHVSMHQNVFWQEASWSVQNWGGAIAFRSYSGHFLSLDDDDSNVHTVQHYDGRPHNKQLFEARPV